MGIHTTQRALNNMTWAPALAAALFFSGTACAKDLPIVESVSLPLSMDKSVVEFPFQVGPVSSEAFIPEKGFPANPPEIKKGGNVLEITPQSPGRIKTIVWGYDHPIFIELAFDKSGERYYKFTQPIGKNEDVQNLESNPHEDVITSLVVAAFNEKAPDGYLSRTRAVGSQNGSMSWRLQVEYVGSEYAVQTWKVTNASDTKVELYDEMFASEKNKIYGISIEAPSLKPGESTRVFIVKKAN